MIADFCIFDMASDRGGRGFGIRGRNQPFTRYKALKNNDRVSLIYALTRSYARLFRVIWPYARLQGVASLSLFAGLEEYQRNFDLSAKSVKGDDGLFDIL